MEAQDFRLAKALAVNSSVLDDVIRLFIQRVIQSQETPGGSGVQFAEDEDAPFALTGTLHRRVVDIEFENAVLEDSENSDKHLIAHVTMYLRESGSERRRLPSPIFILTSGTTYLIKDYVIRLDDDNCSPASLALLRNSLSELILSEIHPTLHFYKDMRDIN